MKWGNGEGGFPVRGGNGEGGRGEGCEMGKWREGRGGRGVLCSYRKWRGREGGNFVKIGQLLDQRRGKGAKKGEGGWVGGNWGKDEGNGEK